MVKGGRVRFSGFRPWHHVTQTPSPFQAPVGRNLFLNDTLHGEILAVCTVNVVRGREGERERARERKGNIKDYGFLFFSQSPATTYSSCC